MAPINEAGETARSPRTRHIWPYLLIGLVVCGVLAVIAYLQPLACLSDTPSPALTQWCRDGSTFPTVARLLGLSCVGTVLGCLAVRMPQRSPWTPRLNAVAWVSVSAGVIGELVLVLSAPAA